MNGLLKFITCGSVDDGKSTLIGHMLYDAKLLFTDQENALKLASKVGSRDSAIDYSLLLDGLMAEREQGITIDVAYRYFSTENRSFIVADTPGHEEYTRNMAVGASFADLAIILVDAQKGILLQTKRHIRICALMGITEFVFAINKMDLVNYEEVRFKEITSDLQSFMESNFSDQKINAYTIPVSATEGDCITKSSSAMQWHKGKTLLSYLESVDVTSSVAKKEFLMAVQRVSRPNLNFRGFQGQVAEGSLSVGEEIIVLPSYEKANVKELFATNRAVDAIVSGEAVTIALDREVDCSRGCVITTRSDVEVSRLFRANLLWTDDEPLIAGRNYLMKLGTKVIPVTVMKLHYLIDVNTGQQISKKQGSKNDLIECDISISEKIAVDAFVHSKTLGKFILINRVSNMTAACGTIKHTLRRSDNLTWQNLEITREMRAAQKNQTPKTIWFTGLSGSGKSTIANALEKMLVAQGKHTMILDGDNVRIGLNNNLGFSETDRIENIRRIAETAKLMNDAGLIVLVAAISPFANDRENAKMILGEAFFEVYVDTSLAECEKRDTKGLYKKARAGKMQNFTGISSPYDIPNESDFVAQTEIWSAEDLAKEIINRIL